MLNVAVFLKKGGYSGREHIDLALKQLKYKMEKEGILDTLKAKRAFETPAERKIRKRRKLQKAVKLAKLQKLKS